MSGKAINKAQAYELAIVFLSAVPAYIERNREAYLRYLEETGQTDPYYKPDTEAADK